MLRIFIVDDETDLLLLLSARLRALGHEVKTAENLSEAKDILLSGYQPNILLLDLNLPDGFGINFLRAHLTFLQNTQIGIVTAFPSQIQHQDLEELPISEVITKPFNLKKIEQFITGSPARDKAG